MRRGTLSQQQYSERRVRKAGAGVDGPYYVWQGTVGGKHFSRRVKAQEAQNFRQGIEARLRFKELCEKYVMLGETLEELDAQQADTSGGLKKTPSLPLRRTQK